MQKFNQEKKIRENAIVSKKYRIYFYVQSTVYMIIIYIYIYIYINTIKSSCTECNKNNIDIQKKHYRNLLMKTSVETFKR